MTLTLSPELEAALAKHAEKRGETIESLAISILSELSALPTIPCIPVDDWGRGLLLAASDCGVSLSNEAVSSEGIYE